MEASLSPGGGGGVRSGSHSTKRGAWGFLEEEEGDGVPGLNRKEEEDKVLALSKEERRRSLESPKEEEEWRVARLGSSF